METFGDYLKRVFPTLRIITAWHTTTHCEHCDTGHIAIIATTAGRYRVCANWGEHPIIDGKEWPARPAAGCGHIAGKIVAMEAI